MPRAEALILSRDRKGAVAKVLMNRPLYLAALRVLGQITNGANYSTEDLSLLRRHARPDELGLPVDVLCCEIIQRELAEPKPN